MRDPNRIDIVLNEIKKLWKENPDLRLTQILYVAASRVGWTNLDIFNLEDTKILEGLENFRKEQEEKEL